MQPVNDLLDAIRSVIRAFMTRLAKVINTASGGRVTPDMITVLSLLAHGLIALLIATRHNLWAALLLLIFGLFDALDGALARVQGTASPSGMLLDASTDRFKEVLLYTGVAYSFLGYGRPEMAAWAVLACGASLCVSYVKAKGETAVKDKHLSANEVNRLFADGLFRFEIRMAILLLGLLSGRVILATIVIAIGASITAVGRLYTIRKRLHVQG